MDRSLRAAFVAGLVASLVTVPARAGERPASVEESLRGMYVGADSSITSVAGTTSALVGPQVGIVAGDYTFGVGAYGLAPTVASTERDAAGRRVDVGLGYGVLRIGTVLLEDRILHVIPLLSVGGGAVRIGEANGTRGEAIFVVEPRLELELALPQARALRFGAQGSYRFVSAFELAGIGARDLAGPSAGMFVKLGFF